MTGVNSFVETLKDLELDEEPRTQVSIVDNELEVIEDMQNNWEDMEEATKKAALKRVHDMAMENIRAEQLRQEAMEEGEPEFHEPHVENGTPRTLYEE
jgi:hypothetical protein